MLLPKQTNTYFNLFKSAIAAFAIPSSLHLIKGNSAPHELCTLAAKELQQHLQTQTDWEHNFGLADQTNENIIGKMFGVLVVQNSQNQIGYLAAFSGKLAGGNHHQKFVPPVFDLLTEDSFLHQGMQKLTTLIDEINQLESDSPKNQSRIKQLKAERKQHSINLQQQIFTHYNFINQKQESKNILAIFKTAKYKNPPAGAGECAGPKLLQYAFQHQLKPLALAEFWWGQSPKSATWKHGHFYACCKEKCEPILAHMLS